MASAWVSPSILEDSVDISNPAAPELVGSADTPARRVAVAGDHACVTGLAGEIHVIDVSDPSNPTLVSTTTSRDYPWGLAMVGNLVFVADRYRGLTIIDISDPTTPAIIGRALTPDQASAVAVAGAFTYVADYGASPQVIETWLPDRPRVIGTRNAVWSERIATDSDLLCLIDEQ